MNVAHSTPNPAASGHEQQLSDLLSRLQLATEAVDSFVDATNGALPNSVLSSIDFHTDSSDSGDSHNGNDKQQPVLLLAPSGEPMTPPPPPPHMLTPRTLKTSGRLQLQREPSSKSLSQSLDATAGSIAAEVVQLQRSVGQLWQRFESTLSHQRANSSSTAPADPSDSSGSPAQSVLLENVRRSNTIASPLLLYTTPPNPPPTSLQVPVPVKPPSYPFAAEQSDYSRLFEGFATNLLSDAAAIGPMTAFNPPSVSPPNILLTEGSGVAPRSNSISSLERRPHGGSLTETHQYQQQQQQAQGANVEQLLADIGLVPPDQPTHLAHRYRTATDRSEGAASEEYGGSLADRASARPSLFYSHPSLDSGLDNSGRHQIIADAGQRSLGSSLNMQSFAAAAGLSLLAATTASGIGLPSGSARGTSVPLPGFGGPAARTQAALAAAAAAAVSQQQQRYPASLLASASASMSMSMSLRQPPVPLLHTQVVPPRNLMSLASAIPEGLTGADENLNNAGLTYTGTGDNRVLRQRMRLRLDSAASATVRANSGSRTASR